MKKFLLNSLYLTLILTILATLTLMSVFYFFGRNLPDYSQLKKYSPPILTRLYSSDGDLFAEYAREKRIFVPIEAIPSHVIKTFLVVEDEHFFDHFGISIPGIMRSILHNIKSKLSGSSHVMGGSTITQQVAKNFLLSSDKTYQRKIKEIILSIRIERSLTKTQILELYLNEIYFGAGNYGIAAAALNYFNKPLDKLTVAEAAFLAALPKAPNNYHPKRHKLAAIKRRNWVISRMQEEGLITAQQAQKAKAEDIILRPHINQNTIDAKFFAEDVRRFIAEKYGEKTLYEEGLVIHTTLNATYQRYADQALQEGILNFDRKQGWRGPLKKIPLTNWQAHLQHIEKPKGIKQWYLAVVLATNSDNAQIGFKNGTHGHIPLKNLTWARQHRITQAGAPYLGPVIKKPADVIMPGDVILVSIDNKENATFALEQIPKIEGALVVLDPHSGKILALSGGFSYERSEFNRATQAMRQTGSAFKPFTYLAALEKGYSPTSIILDAPFVYDPGPKQELWKPKNIEKRFFGPNTLRVALEKSMNVSVVRLAHTIGMQPIVSIARRLNIYPNLPPYLSTVLGSEETTLLQFTTAYGVLVNGGKKITPYMIDQIQNRHGKTLLRREQDRCLNCIATPATSPTAPDLIDTRPQIVDPISAYQIVSILEGVSLRGTGRRGRPENHIVGLKTGTSNDYKDVWTIGFSKDLVVGVYLGYDQPRSLGRYNTGGAIAAPIFKSFMEKALQGRAPQPFKIPSGTKFIKINRQTGARATPKDKDVILEAFKPDQEPNSVDEKNSNLSNDIFNGIY